MKLNNMNSTKELVIPKVKNILDLEDKLTVRDGIIEQTPELLNFLKTAKEIEEQIEASYGYLKEQMVKYDVRAMKGDWGSLTIAERLNWNVIGKLQPKFYKKVPDTAKMKAYYVAMDRLPAGVDVTTTKYLSKKLKV